MSKVTFDYSKACGFVQDHEMQYMSELAEQAKEKLLARTGAGNDFLGWIDLPVDYDKDEFDRIKKAAEKIREDSEVLLVIGIGGSYLGARAAIEFLGHSFANVVSKEVRKSPEIYYVGNSISSTYVKDLIDVIGDRDFSINMISKSGTTTEPAIAFRVFKELLEKKYGKEEAAKRIYATTDKAKGALKNLATEEGYETFVVPDDVGGRYSVLTAVGLLPIAALSHLKCRGKNVVPVLSGGNMDVITVASLVQHGLINRGRVFTFSVQLPDRPGELLRVAQLVAEANGNIIKLEHNQFVNINRQSGVELRVTLEAFGHTHKRAILDALCGAGYAARECHTNDFYH